MSTNVKLVRLVTSEEVIFEVIEDAVNVYKAKKPIALHVVPQGNEQYGLQLFPYSPSNPEGEQLIFKDKIVSESVEVPEGLVKAYVQRTTGIEIASAVDAFANLGR